MIINLRTRNKTQILLAEAQSNQNQKIRIKKFEGAMHKTLTLEAARQIHATYFVTLLLKYSYRQ